ncbi:MAG: T9SS type A sorting domain-containing protein [Candidatus Cloacimonetes bacterium]|jgi:hypothetical protein|nr:T9SS type A sorting domain-containing protein [Candidatus Cloacimonadota bacterium]
MKKLFLFFVLLAPVILCSTVIPAGDVSGVWDLAGSPYYVDGEITIQSETELEIEAGVDVIFNDLYKFFIMGRLVANGTVNDSIKFTPLNVATGWHGLHFIDGNLSSLLANEISYCQFKQGYGLGTEDEKNGGAIFCLNTSNLTIENSLFYQNYSEWDGGAIYLGNGSDVEINNCMFLQNDCGFYGGGIITYGSDPILNGCTFKENTASIFAAGFSFWTSSNPELYNCIFIDNYAGACAGIYGVNSNLKMANILLLNNETQYGSGAACGLTSCITEVTNITAADNVSPLSGGAFWVNDGTLILNTSILWNNMPENIFVVSGSVNASNSCISDGFTGTAIISDNPQFVDYANLDLHLTGTSPCIDTGDETLVTFPLPAFDLDGNDRIIDGDQNGTATIDMGVYEFVPAVNTGFIAGTVTDSDGNFLENAEITAGIYSVQTDINGEYEMEVEVGDYTVSCYLEGYEIPDDVQVTVIASETSVADFILEEEVNAENQLLPFELTLLGNYPNPFNPSTTISFSLPQNTNTSISIFNLKGQFVKELSNDFLTAGTHQFTWNGKDEKGKKATSGLYFYEIKTDSEIKTGKMLMLK